MEKIKTIEILDSTTREGEQVVGVHFNKIQKEQIVFSLFNSGVDYIELTSVNHKNLEETEIAKAIFFKARQENLESKIEILGFLDNGLSIEWINKVGGRVINLLTKGSEFHCRQQLSQTPEEHWEKIKEEVLLAKEKGLIVNLYLEDWSGGFLDYIENNNQYIKQMIQKVSSLPINRLMFADTRGVLFTELAEKFLKESIEWARQKNDQLKYDFHCHNDICCALHNSLKACEAGIDRVHVTVNGLGERAGNTRLEEFVVLCHDQTKFTTNFKIEKLDSVCQLVANCSGRRIPPNTPIVGSIVNSNKAGVHTHGDRKSMGQVQVKMYGNPNIFPERFGRDPKKIIDAPLGKLAGKASVKENLDKLGVKLPEVDENVLIDKIMEEVRVLSSRKGQDLTLGDFLFILSRVLKQQNIIVFKIIDVTLVSQKERTALASAVVEYKGAKFEIFGQGNGGIDAFMNALRVWQSQNQNFVIPTIYDYLVDIPEGGKSSAVTKATIFWQSENSKPSYFQTIGIDSDQGMAAIKAISDALNICNSERT